MSADPESFRPPRWLPLAAVAVCLFYLAAEVWLLSGLGFPLDDSWIHLQFARNLAAGDGLSYNPGQWVTGSTAPLWTAVLALLFVLPGSVLAWTKIVGIALFAAGIDATWRLARELGLGRGLASLAAGLTLASGWLVWSALSGMEIPLFILLSLWGMILHGRERRAPEGDARPPLSLAVLAVSALARPEGLLLLAAAFVDRCLRFERDESEPDAPLRWRRPSLATLLAGVALAACALAGTLLFYRWAGGSFLPTTFGAKGGALRRWLPQAEYVALVLGILFRAQPVMTWLSGAGVVALVSRVGTPRDRGLLPALWLVGLPLAYSTMSGLGPKAIAGNFGRYYFPMIPVVVVLGVLGLEPAARAVGRRMAIGRARVPVGALLIALLIAPTLAGLFQGASHYLQNVANVQNSDVKIARWLGERLPPEAVLAVNDIGAIKFLLPNRIIDLAAIANPEILREVRRSVAAGRSWTDSMIEAIARRQPDYLVVFPSWFPGLDHDPRFRAVYLLHIPDNVTMGGDDIVIYETPWTRHPLRKLPGE